MKDTIKTERLILRPCTLEDSEALYEYMKNPNVGPHAGWAPHKSLEETKEIVKSIFLNAKTFVICLPIGNEESKVIGIIGLENDIHRPDGNSREIGYSLAEEHWGNGYMTEAAKAVIEYGFNEMGLDQIAIGTSDENIRSQRVISKCGFVYEGTIRRSYKTYDGSLRNTRIYSILRSEWESGKDKS